jgi:DNA topoisomerase-1
MADAKYKKKKKTEDGETVYEYSDKQVQHRNREKAKKVEKLNQNIDKLRKKVKEDLKSDDDRKRLQALAVALMDKTYERVGNEKSAKENEHYGVTVWKKKHISVSGNKVTFDYTGKSGVDHKKTIEDAALAKALKEQMEGKDKDDFIFDCDDGKDKTCVRAKDVNEYLTSFDITAKDVRGYHANRLMQEELKKVRKGGKKLPEDKKEREKVLEKEFKKALENVAKEVGHEAATLRSNYLVPALEHTYMGDGTVIKKLDKKKSATSKVAKSVKIAKIVAHHYLIMASEPTFNDFLESGQVYTGPMTPEMVASLEAAGVEEGILEQMRARIESRNND